MVPWPCSRLPFDSGLAALVGRVAVVVRGRGRCSSRCVSILSDIGFSRGVFALTRTKFSQNSISYILRASSLSSNVTGDV